MTIKLNLVRETGVVYTIQSGTCGIIHTKRKGERKMKVYTTECHKVNRKPMFVTCYCSTGSAISYRVFDNNRDACDFSRQLSEKCYKYDANWEIPSERIRLLSETFGY